jgi:hypothetical protein
MPQIIRSIRIHRSKGRVCDLLLFAVVLLDRDYRSKWGFEQLVSDKKEQSFGAIVPIVLAHWHISGGSDRCVDHWPLDIISPLTSLRS